MKKKTKVFIGTLVIMSTFFIGSVLGSEALLVFTGTSTIDKAKELIQDLTERNNTIVDEYNELDSTATEKIKSLEEDINSLKVKVDSLTQERDKLISEQSNNTQQIVSLQQKIESLESEIARKDAELKSKDRLLESKDEKIKYYENIEPTKEISRLRTELETANSKCNELQTIIGNTDSKLKEFTKSDLVKN